MTYNPDIHKRKSIRLKDYDYSQEGLYFITICTKNRENLFGEIVGAGASRPNDYLFKKVVGVGFSHPNDNLIVNTKENEIILNKIGMVIKNEYINLKNKYKNIKCHEYVIMPNHFHCLIEIIKHQEGGKTPPLPEIIGYFKFQTTKRYNEIMEIKNESFLSLWQRNYYENIIRNEKRHLQVIEYIENNPTNWVEDRHYV